MLSLSYFSPGVVVLACDKVKKLKWNEKARKRIGDMRDWMARIRKGRREKRERNVAVELEKKRGIVGVEAII